MESQLKLMSDLKRLVREVGCVQIANFRKKSLLIDSKSTCIDLVTEVDGLSEDIILNYLKRTYPKHAILSEESGIIENESDYLWIVDPLDGTNNYANGIPWFGISIALQYKKDTILGVVYIPVIDEMFSAVKGEGAFLNETKLEIGCKKNLNESIIASGFPYDRSIHDANNVPYASRIIPKLRGFRRCGAAAIDLSYVAAGFFDGYWEVDVKTWDVAAGMLLVRESGGNIIHFRDDRNVSIIAGNEIICKLLLCEIEAVDKKL